MANIQIKRGNGVPPTLLAGEPAFDLTSHTLYIGDGSTNTSLISGSRSITINGNSQDLSTDRIWTLTTSDISEGSNLYYTSTRFDNAFGFKSTTDLVEGTNLYYTTSRFTSAFSTKTTDDLTQGSTNKYFTNSLARGAISLTTVSSSGAATYNSTTGVLNVPSYSTGGGTWGSITGTLSSQTDLQNALDTKVDENSPITGDTKTKITYDVNGLITSGADATTADIADSTNKRYVTDTQLVVIGNTSGVNTGDQTSVSGNAGTTTALQVPRNINGVVFDGTTNITITSDASTLTNTVLKSTVVTSSLTSLGTIAIGVWQGTAIGDTYISSSSNWNTAYVNRITTFTTTGSSGAATLSSNTLNIPNYTLSGLGGTPSTRNINTTAPLSGGGDLSADRTLIIVDAAADGSTKGAATFTATDFNSASGVISIDYTNGQAASGSNKGFLISADWTTFNNKQTALGFTPVNNTTTVNGHALSSNVTVTADDVLPSQTSNNGKFLTTNGTTASWGTVSGSGTVTSVSVTSANGFAGSVATSTTTPAITISTSIIGVLIGNGTAISAATAGTDYTTPSSTETVTNKNLTSGTNTFPTLNQNTSGSAATLITPRAIYGNNFDGSVALAQIIASTYGGTGNGFTKFSGPASTEKTFTLPNTSATVLTDNTAVTVAQGGTGLQTLTTHNMMVGNGTSNVTFLAPSTSGKIVISNGTDFVMSTPTYPNASATSGKIIVSDGTNYIASTPTFPNVSATTKKMIKSDGTNWVASTETYDTPGTANNIMISDGTNWKSTALGAANYNTNSGAGGTNILSTDTIIGTVTITPSSTSAPIIISATAEFTKDTGTTVRTIVFKVKNSAGTTIGQTRTSSSAATASIIFPTAAISIAEVPASTSAQTYTLAATCATGTPITGHWSVTVFEAAPAGPTGATGAAGSTGATGPSQGISINQQTGTSYTLLSSDNGKIVECTNGSAVTVTLPSGLGTTFGCTISQVGAGQVTLAASGTTIHNAHSYTKSSAQWTAYSILPTNTTDVFITQGDMA